LATPAAATSLPNNDNGPAATGRSFYPDDNASICHHQTIPMAKAVAPVNVTPQKMATKSGNNAPYKST
jgi:hypothetical protein